MALDASPDECRRLAEQTSVAGMHKIGLTAFTTGGSDLVRDLARSNCVFLDLKLHDIPAQVAGAVSSIGELGASFTTIHASGGTAMMRAAADAAGAGVTLLAVTVLTSLDDADLGALGVDRDPATQVLRMAELAHACGIPGLVCSPHEVRAVRERFGARHEGGPLVVVPGIRPPASAPGDQKRTLGPREAIDVGADVLVVGRPITRAADPARAARLILDEIGS